MKIAINVCYGGFGLSADVYQKLGIADEYWLDNETFDIKSDNSDAWRAYEPMIAAIEEIGVVESSGSYAKLKIVDVPGDVNWHIHEYDGTEYVAEDHRIWS